MSKTEGNLIDKNLPVVQTENLDSRNKNNYLDKPNLDNLSTSQKVKEACTFLLLRMDKKSSENTTSSAELLTKVKEEFPNDFPEEFAKNTFYQYLSNAVRDPDVVVK